MHNLYFKMGTQSLRAGSSILSAPGVLVLIALAVAHPTREFFVGLNEAGHRGQKLALVVVRDALALTNYSRTVFSVVSASEKASKYPLRSVTDLIEPFA